MSPEEVRRWWEWDVILEADIVEIEAARERKRDLARRR